MEKYYPRPHNSLFHVRYFKEAQLGGCFFSTPDQVELNLDEDFIIQILLRFLVRLFIAIGFRRYELVFGPCGRSCLWSKNMEGYQMPERSKGLLEVDPRMGPSTSSFLILLSLEMALCFELRDFKRC